MADLSCPESWIPRTRRSPRAEELLNVVKGRRAHGEEVRKEFRTEVVMRNAARQERCYTGRGWSRVQVLAETSRDVLHGGGERSGREAATSRFFNTGGYTGPTAS